MESAPSRTAMFAAVSRGLFRLETPSPWVLDDVLALVLVGPVWQQLRDQFDPLFPGPVRREARAAVCTRSRYAEDRLAADGFTQYVILGAGLDSFAWRRPDLLGSLTVFAAAAPGSEVVFSYRAEDCVLDDVGTEYARTYTPIAASVGEPLQPGWPVSEIERLISRCGLKVVDHPARADLQQRYFAGRADGLRPCTFETLVAARVT